MTTLPRPLARYIVRPLPTGPHGAVPLESDTIVALAVAAITAIAFAAGLDALAAGLAPCCAVLALRRRLPWQSALGALAAGLLFRLSIGPALPDWIGFLLGTAPIPLNRGAPNVWAIADAIPALASLQLQGLAVAATIGMVAIYIARLSVRPMRARDALPMALLSTLIVSELAPALAAADLLPAAALAALAYRYAPETVGAKECALVLAGVALGAFAPALSALPLFVVTALLSHTMLTWHANDNPLLAR